MSSSLHFKFHLSKAEFVAAIISQTLQKQKKFNIDNLVGVLGLPSYIQ
jgi:hypothetical protein